MFNTLQIYDELSQTLDQKSARKLVNVLSSMYEELQNTVTKQEFSELREAVHELAQAQQRTEDRLTTLAERVEELAAAQKRTEARVEELAVAQKRTEDALQHLSKRVDHTNKQFGGLNMTVGYVLENEAYRFLPELLRRDWRVELLEDLRHDWLPTTRATMVEVNIIGKGRRDGATMLILSESKLQLSRKHVDAFLKTRVQKIDTGGLSVLPVIVAHMESEPGVAQYAKERGVAVYFSYQFRAAETR